MKQSSNLAPNAVRSFPDDALLYEPSGMPHVVEMSLPDGRIHRTITGTAFLSGDDAQGPDAGTTPENEYDAGTERFVIGVRRIGPPVRSVDQIAPFITVGSERSTSGSGYTLVHGVIVSGITPVHEDEHVGVFVNIGVLAFVEVRSIQFHVTYTGIPADPSWEPPTRD